MFVTKKKRVNCLMYKTHNLSILGYTEQVIQGFESCEISEKMGRKERRVKKVRYQTHI